MYDRLPGYIIRDDEKDEEVLKNKLSCAIRDAAYGDDSTMSRRRKKYREVYMSECDGNVIRGNKISSNYSTIIAYLKNVFIAKGKKIDIQTHFLKLGSCTKFSYFLNCFKLMPKIASARYVFIDDCSNVIASLKLRKKTKVIQTWHACGALKKFGLDTGGKGYYGNEDVVCLSTPNIIPCYQHAMGLPADRFYPIGVPRSDVFFQETYMAVSYTHLTLPTKA